MKKINIIFMATFLIQAIIFVKTNSDDYRYNPYPVILVHGFSSSPWETWGTATFKDTNKESSDYSHIISNYMRDQQTNNYSVEIGKKLIQEYDKDSVWFSQYKQEPSDTMSDPWERLIPHEEENSYSGFNHTFIEPYCSYYRFESNDGSGVAYPRFSIEGREYPKVEERDSGDIIFEYVSETGLADYKRTEIIRNSDGGTICVNKFYDLYLDGELIKENVIATESGGKVDKQPLIDKFRSEVTYNEDYDISKGGQTQLLRIRIIQVLNEYYGDFKWVNDPSAKINIVAHSNGGLITTNLLKNEESDGWYNILWI